MADLTALKERLVRLQREKQVAAPNIVVNIQLPDITEALARRFGDGEGHLRTSARFTPSAG